MASILTATVSDSNFKPHTLRLSILRVKVPLLWSTCRGTIGSVFGRLRIFGGEVSGKEMDPEMSLQYKRCFPSKVALQQDSRGHRSPGSCWANPRGRRSSGNRSIFPGICLIYFGKPSSSTAQLVVTVQSILIEEVE